MPARNEAITKLSLADSGVEGPRTRANRQSQWKQEGLFPSEAGNRTTSEPVSERVGSQVEGS
jgi:hypothetical protein